MKTLYLDCGMGAAGDMLTAALLELLPDKQAAVDELNALGIPGIEYVAETSVKCGITGTHMSVKINGQEETTEDVHDHHHHHDDEEDHDHDHDHEHHHHHDDEDHDHDHDEHHHHHDDEEHDHHHDHEHHHHHDDKTIADNVSADPEIHTHVHEEEEHEHTHEHEHHHHHDDEDHEHTHDHHHHHDDDHDHEHHHDHDHDHYHDHDHDHHHHDEFGEHTHTYTDEEGHVHTHTHSHNNLHGIEHIVKDHLNLPEKVLEDVMAVYGLIAEAESHAHNQPVDQIHFHEVGTMDAVADVTAVCYLMNKIAPDQVVVSPVHVGSGKVRCAHGILPVPAPATAYILQGVPIYGGRIQGELCTPTGAALLKHFATRFGDMPTMVTEKIGYGMGKKDFEAANCVRAILGNTEEAPNIIVELTCNVDDMTGEALGYAMEKLFDAGAVEVYTVNVGMKKSRPGIMLCVMAPEKKKDDVIAAVFKHTTTIGIRESYSKRYTLKRRFETVETPYGDVTKKVSFGYGVERSKLEFEDLARISRETGKSLNELRSEIERL